MENLIEKLINPFAGLDKDEFQNKCNEIAKTLFNDYCINCNGKEFYLAEIEFYYQEKNKWDDKWNMYFVNGCSEYVPYIIEEGTPVSIKWPQDAYRYE